MAKEEATYEMAVESCGLGCFTVWLIISVFPSFAAMVFASSSVAFILPTAECDLQLDLLMKGALNAIAYGGMIVSGVPWGYLADVFGRKPVLIVGHFIDFAFVVCSSLSQNTTHLLVFKFFNGFVICGPFATAMSYISEFHSKKHRSIVLMIAGMMVALSTLILPIIAYIMLPEHTMFRSEQITFHNWHYFLLSTSIASLLSGILFIFLPESPKFLMAKGRGDEAFNIFRKVYALNKRKKKSDFPYESLEDEAPERTSRNRSYILLQTKCPERTCDKFKDGCQDMKLLFQKAHLWQTCLVCLVQCLILMTLNSIRLWLPSIFVTITELEQMGYDSSSMCTIIYFNVNRSRTDVGALQDCGDVHIEADSYLNNIIVAGTVVIGYILMTILVIFIGNYIVSLVSLVCAFIAVILLYFSINAMMTLSVASVFITFCGIASTSIVTLAVNHFPTAIRTMMIILVMTSGRIGSLIGNILLPVLFEWGCVPTFASIASCILISFIIAIFFPRHSTTDLK